MEKLQNLKPSIIETKNPKKMGCFVNEYLVQRKTSSALAASTNVYDSEMWFATDAELK